jgi:hypothetical protein
VKHAPAPVCVRTLAFCDRCCFTRTPGMAKCHGGCCSLLVLLLLLAASLGPAAVDGEGAAGQRGPASLTRETAAPEHCTHGMVESGTPSFPSFTTHTTSLCSHLTRAGHNHPRRALLDTQAANQRDRRWLPGNNNGGSNNGGGNAGGWGGGGGSSSMPAPAPAPQWTQPSRGGGNNNWMSPPQGNGGRGGGNGGGGDQGRGNTPRGGGGGSWWQQPPRPAAPAPIVLPPHQPTPQPTPQRQPRPQAPEQQQQPRPIRGWGGNRGGRDNNNNNNNNNRDERDRDGGDRANKGPGQPLQGLPGWMGGAGGSSGLPPVNSPAWQVPQPMPGGQPIRDVNSGGRDNNRGDTDRGEGRNDNRADTVRGGSNMGGNRERPDLSRYTTGLERFRGISARPINTQVGVAHLRPASRRSLCWGQLQHCCQTRRLLTETPQPSTYRLKTGRSRQPVKGHCSARQQPCCS